VACLPERQTENKNAKPYFDIKGLITEQGILLDSINPLFVKTVSVDGKEEVLSDYKPHGNWSVELDLFNELDLNKPNLYGKYKLDEINTDSTFTLLYTSLSSKTTQYDTLIITLGRNSKKPEKIHGVAHTSNMLFESNQVVDLAFSKINQCPVLSSSKVWRYQKLMTNQPSIFTLELKAEQP
jgi:hypothetical protein